MDATQKQKMRKVAITHFLLTVFVVWILLHYGAWSGPMEKRVWFEAWGSFWGDVFFLLQPPLWFLSNVGHFDFVAKAISVLPVWLMYCLIISSIPVWSYCFGWIFVKLDNWLNHFPVLGKRVF